MKRIWLFISFYLSLYALLPTSVAQGYFELSSEIEQAYNEIIELRFDAARSTIASIKSSEPNNLSVYHIENYIDFFTVFINEDEGEYERLLKNKATRLKKIRQGDPDSPYYKFAQAEIMLQWILLRTKFGKPNLWMAKDLVGDLNRSYRLLEQNAIDHPDFQLTKKSLAMLHALADYAPSWFRRIMNVQGSIEMGMQEINELTVLCASEPIIFEHEIFAINAYMRLHLANDAEGAWSVITSSNLDASESGLAAFMIASVALKTGRNEAALQALVHRPTGDQFFEFLYLDWLRGKALLQRLDSDARVYIDRFIDQFDGRHFIKEAVQKRAWYELVILDNEAGYRKQMTRLVRMGRTDVEDDKQALKEAKSQSIPNKTLLSTRLLYDGGYYQDAMDLLVDRLADFRPNDDITEEYHYRQGRISQALNIADAAIGYYNRTINHRVNNQSFYACNAALQSGLILEQLGQPERARKYLELCLDMSPAIYRSELHKKAKAGLQRIR